MKRLTKTFKLDVDTKSAIGEAGNGAFTGRASVYGVTDFHNDVVMPGAFADSIKALGGRIKVLNQHDPSDPIGWAMLEDSAMSLDCSGTLELDLPSAREAFVRLKSGLIDGISIGYSVPAGGASYKDGVRQLAKIDLWEISLVTFPANDYARVTGVKSLELCADIVRELKAGRVLSAANREKVKAAHGSLSDAISVLQYLLDMTDEGDAAAKAASLKAVRGHLARKSGPIEDAAMLCDAMIDALGESFDSLLEALGLPDAPASADAAAAELASAAAALETKDAFDNLLAEIRGARADSELIHALSALAEDMRNRRD